MNPSLSEIPKPPKKAKFVPNHHKQPPSPINQVRKLQRLTIARAENPETTDSVFSSLVRDWLALQEKKEHLRWPHGFIPAPDPKKVAASNGAEFTEPSAPPAKPEPHAGQSVSSPTPAPTTAQPKPEADPEPETDAD